MPFDMKTLTLDVAAATSSTVLFGAIGGQTDSQPIPIPINIIGTYVQANFGGAVANPTATIGLTAVNGALSTAMRSDGAPALSQAIAPTWTGQHIFNNAVTQLGSTSQLQWSTDLILTRNAAATFQFGAADAAAPVAQTVGVQNVVAGNANTAAANFTIRGGLSNGSGGGDLILQTTLSTAGSGVQNTAATALTLKGATQAVIAASYFVAGGTAPAGIQAGDIAAARTSAIGAVFFGSDATSYILRNGGTDFQILTSNVPFRMNSGTAALLQLGPPDGATATAQTLQVQNVAAGNSNVNGANWTLNGSVSTGTGTSGDIIFQTGGTGAGATSQNAEVTALTIKGATQQVILATNLRINVAPTVNGSASTTITSGADSSTNLGHRISFNLNGTTYWIPCGSVAF